MKEIVTETDINASPERVWEILTDFPSYVLWNPYIHRAYGRVQEGEKIEVHIHVPGAEETTFFPTITKVVPERELSWLGHLYLPGMFDGEHQFIIEPREDGVHFIHRETFNGVLVPLMIARLEDSTRQGFTEMDRALKARAEAPVHE